MCLKNVESAVVMACMLLQYVCGTQITTVMVYVGKMVNRSVQLVYQCFISYFPVFFLKHAQYNTILTLSLPVFYTTKRNTSVVFLLLG